MGVFDIEHKNKCPKCGKEMDYLYGKRMCSNCGYTAEVETDIKDEDKNPDIMEVPSRLSIEEERYRSVSIQDEKAKKDYIEVEQISNSCVEEKTYARFENDYQMDTYDTNQNRKKMSGATIAVIVILVIFVINALLSVLDIMIQKTGSVFEQVVMPDEVVWDYEDDWLTEESITYPFDKYPFEYLEDGENTYTEGAQSYGMMEFVETVFGKSYHEVTAEEFASIVYLDFYYNSDGFPTVTYGILTEEEPEYGEYFEVSLQSFDYYNTDFSVFPNLNTLYLIDYVDVGSLKGLDELCVFGSNMVPVEIVEYINPEQLISLTLYDAISLDGIEQFSNLTSLYINAAFVENIDMLKTLTGLKNLGIFYGDSITDFQSLNYLTEMENLTITSSTLNDLSFIANMPQLVSLALGDCCYAKTSEWDYIAFASSLHCLRLENCYVPYSVEKFMALPNLEYFDVTKCMTGIDMENLSSNEKLWGFDVTGTTFLKVENGVWEDTAEEIYIADCIEQLYEYYPNLRDVYY